MNEKNDWGDFEVPLSQENPKSAREVFDSYLLFKETVDSLPQAELVKRGWIKEKGDSTSMLPLMQEILSSRNNILYRRSDTANEARCSAWVSIVRLKAKFIALSEDTPQFNGIDKDYLKYIANLSVDEIIPIRLPEILKEQGIILIYEPSLPGMKLDGVVFRMESGNPVIGHSFRFPRLDNFWFTLLHELSHIVLHLEDLDNPIYENLEEENKELKEMQADRLAKASFVSRKDWRNCQAKYDKSDDAVIAFAEKMRVHPAIIAGMLRKEENIYTIYNKIINGIDIRKMVFNNE
jgi:HTH-type transcriptional regulator/antitoxin HigA